MMITGNRFVWREGKRAPGVFAVMRPELGLWRGKSEKKDYEGKIKIREDWMWKMREGD